MGGAIGNEGFDIVFYLALMVPLEYLLTSRRVVADGNRRKAAMIAGGVLAAVSAVKLGLEMAHKAPSYYDKLEVMPTANHAEMQGAHDRNTAALNAARAELAKVKTDKPVRALIGEELARRKLSPMQSPWLVMLGNVSFVALMAIATVGHLISLWATLTFMSKVGGCLVW